MRTRHFKMMLTAAEHQQLKALAGDQRISSADLVRHLVLGSNAPRRMPSGSTLRDIAFTLSGISSNLDKCMREIHSAKLRGALNENQFEAMYNAIRMGLKLWAEPRNDLRNAMRCFKGNQ